MNEQKPSAGRIVHFAPPSQNVGPESIKLVAAIITQVNPEVKGVPGDSGSDKAETVELATFGPNSLYFQHNVPFSPEPKPGCWFWPART